MVELFPPELAKISLIELSVFLSLLTLIVHCSHCIYSLKCLLSVFVHRFWPSFSSGTFLATPALYIAHSLHGLERSLWR